jgi:hypothetical protein
LRLANLPNFALDRVGRYEAILDAKSGAVPVSEVGMNRRPVDATAIDYRGGRPCGPRVWVADRPHVKPNYGRKKTSH